MSWVLGSDDRTNVVGVQRGFVGRSITEHRALLELQFLCDEAIESSRADVKVWKSKEVRWCLV